MNLLFDYDYQKLQRELDAVGRRALPKAAAGYLNGIAIQARKNMIKHNSEAFDGHVAFTDRGWRYSKARASDGERMASAVNILPKQEAYMYFQIFGGDRKVGDAGSGPYDLFVHGDNTNAAGNIRWGYVKRLSKQNREEKAERKEWQAYADSVRERREWDMGQYAPGVYQDLSWVGHNRNKPGIFWGKIGGVEGYWKRPKLTKKSRKRRKGVHSVRVRQGSHLTPLLSVAKLAHYKPIFKYDIQIEKAMAAMGGQDAFRREFDRAMSKL